MFMLFSHFCMAQWINKLYCTHRLTPDDIENLKNKVGKGDVEAMLQLAEWYGNVPYPENDARANCWDRAYSFGYAASELYAKAAEADNTDAKLNRARHLLHLQETTYPNHIETALSILNDVAQKEDGTDAMFWLGVYYQQAGSPWLPLSPKSDYNPKKSREWYLKGARAGNVSCMYGLVSGYILEDVNISEEEMTHWTEEALHRGDYSCMNELAHFYLGKRDTVKAIPLLERSSKNGNTYSSYALTRIYTSEESSYYNPSKALKWHLQEMENVLNGVESVRKNRHNYMISNIYTLKVPEYFGKLLFRTSHYFNKGKAYTWEQEEIDATFYMLYLLKSEKVYDAVGNLCNPDHTVIMAFQDFYNYMDKNEDMYEAYNNLIFKEKKLDDAIMQYEKKRFTELKKKYGNKHPVPSYGL